MYSLWFRGWDEKVQMLEKEFPSYWVEVEFSEPMLVAEHKMEWTKFVRIGPIMSGDITAFRNFVTAHIAFWMKKALVPIQVRRIFFNPHNMDRLTSGW